MEIPRVTPPEALKTAITNLSSQEVKQLASRLIGNKITASKESVDKWTDERVKGVRYKDVNILTVDWDTVFESKPDEILTKIVSSPQTNSVAVEYFTPELAANVPHGIFGKYFENKVTNPIKKEPTVFKKRVGQYTRRLSFAKELADTLQTAKKDVLCFDIANKPIYMVLRDGKVLAQMGIGKYLGKGIDTLAAKAQYETNGLFADLGVKIPLISWAYLQVFNQIVRKGIYDTKAVNKFDQRQLHLEDARRLIIAEGITQHVDRLRAQGDKGEKTIIVVYPKAHNLRIHDYMKKVTSGDQSLGLTIKDNAYRLLSGPILDFKERNYSFDGTKWNKVASHPITRIDRSTPPDTQQVFYASSKPTGK
jgi:hypothetical protein